jgi:biopolymer transport protein TolQ
MTGTTHQSAAVESVTGVADVAGNVTMDMSAWGMFLHADIVVKTIMVGLLLASFWSWAIIFQKMARFGDVKSKSTRFEQEFWSAETLDGFYEKIKRRATHPMAVVFMAAMEEWLRSGKARTRGGMTLATGSMDRIAKVMSVARNREIEILEKNMGFLMAVASSALLVGLFGTVWGIMTSFQSIAHANNTSLAVVAPGIAEALFATAVGLFAAIPAMVAFNRFSSELDKIAGKIEDFETEFLTLLSRQADEVKAAA